MKDTNEFQTNLDDYCSNCNINRFLAVCYTWGVEVSCLWSMIIDENEMETLSNYYISS